MTRKESVKIRQRKLSDGTTSLYLDIMHNGKRTREFLKLYLNEEKSRADKEYNRQIMAQAEMIRSQRQIEVQSKQYEVLHEFKTNTYFLPYYREMCEERFRKDSRGNWGNWSSCLRHLEAYLGRSEPSHIGSISPLAIDFILRCEVFYIIYDIIAIFRRIWMLSYDLSWSRYQFIKP